MGNKNFTCLHNCIYYKNYFNFRKKESNTIYPADVIMFEGILTIYFKEIRDMLDMKLFVDTDSDTRLSRRGEVPALYLGLCSILGNTVFFGKMSAQNFLTLEN